MRLHLTLVGPNRLFDVPGASLAIIDKTANLNQRRDLGTEHEPHRPWSVRLDLLQDGIEGARTGLMGVMVEEIDHSPSTLLILGMAEY